MKLQTLSVSDLKKSGDKRMDIAHPHIPCIIHIYKEMIKGGSGDVLWEFQGVHHVIEDDLSSIHSKHKVNLDEIHLVSYVSDLLSAQSVDKYRYIRNLKEKRLAVNDIIQFSDASKGVVCAFNGLEQIKYTPLKQDGTKSKVQPRYLYGDLIYQNVGKYVESTEKTAH